MTEDKNFFKKLFRRDARKFGFAFVFGFGFSDFVQSLNEFVGVYAVSERAFFYAFKLRRVAAEATHARVHENHRGVGVALNDFDYVHVFCNLHKKFLLCVAGNYITQKFCVNEFTLKNFFENLKGNFSYSAK